MTGKPRQEYFLVDETAAEVAAAANQASSNGNKFVTFAIGDGQRIAIIAGDIDRAIDQRPSE